MAGRHLPRIATPGRTSFKGPIRQGLNTGIPDTISIGETILSQRADISAAETSATTVFVLPSDNEGGAVRSDIISIDVMVDVIFEDSAQAVIEFALLSAGGTSLGEVRVSVRSCGAEHRRSGLGSGYISRYGSRLPAFAVRATLGGSHAHSRGSIVRRFGGSERDHGDPNEPVSGSIQRRVWRVCHRGR